MGGLPKRCKFKGFSSAANPRGLPNPRRGVVSLYTLKCLGITQRMHRVV